MFESLLNTSFMCGTLSESKEQTHFYQTGFVTDPINAPEDDLKLYPRYRFPTPAMKRISSTLINYHMTATVKNPFITPSLQEQAAFYILHLYGYRKVIVPPGCRTTAELVISEDEYDGKFRVETIFSGTITVHFRDKRDGSDVYVIKLNDLSRVFTAEHGFQPVPGQPGAVCFVNEGHCHCHFGIGQQVVLHQEQI
ncbi:unnamed protein product [Echinostoma caproni]|uniref:DUF5680 domain-containing protein n=1 Tax=Echinostoma caproni TaxID=27848 RepID=A0A183ABZ0_9TREM|nr:unnamed protein product [Echinostoma caproni]